MSHAPNSAGPPQSPPDPVAEAKQRLPHATIENLETVTRLRDAAWHQRGLSERLADRVGDFVGHVGFVALQLVLLGVWAAFNTPLVPGLPVFDPYPFNLLSLLVSVEAVIITVFVLIRQTHMSRMDERRAHVELQMTLLTEKEVTKLIRMLDRITTHLGIPDAMDDETREMAEHTEVETLAHAVRDRLD